MTDTAAKVIRELPGIKEDDLDGPCLICGKPFIRQDYPPMFFRLRVERLIVDTNAVRRRHGLGLMLGSDPLARVMGPNEDIAKIIAGPKMVFVCETCILEKVPHFMIALEDDAS